MLLQPSSDPEQTKPTSEKSNSSIKQNMPNKSHSIKVDLIPKIFIKRVESNMTSNHPTLKSTLRQD